MAAFTLAAISGGMAVILCAVLACSAPLAITSASSLPSMTALQPGIKSPHLSTFAMVALPSVLLVVIERDPADRGAPPHRGDDEALHHEDGGDRCVDRRSATCRCAWVGLHDDGEHAWVVGLHDDAEHTCVIGFRDDAKHTRIVGFQ